MTKILFTPTRHFNSLTDCGDYFIKSSVDKDKIKAEISYYQQLPKNLLKYHPKYLGTTRAGTWEDGYCIEKINESDLGIFFTNIRDVNLIDFDLFFDKLKTYFNLCPLENVSKETYLNLVNEQFILRDIYRVKLLSSKHIFDTVNQVYSRRGHNNIYKFMDNLHNLIREGFSKEKELFIWSSHGDLCLSNIIMQDSQLFFIDPRGYHKDENQLLPHYDIAKLTQCFLYHYDYINHFLKIAKDKKRYNYYKEKIEELCEYYKIDFRLTLLITASHFLSMLPLHISSSEKVLAFTEQSIKAFEDAINE